MAIKWVVTDMDGTLLDEHDCISEEAREYLIRAQQQGVRLVLASGRSYARLMPYVEELRMREYGGLLIEVNGLAVQELATGKRQVFAQLSQEDIAFLFSLLQTWQVELQGYEDETLYYWIPDWMRPIKRAVCEAQGYPEGWPMLASAWDWVSDGKNPYPNLIEIKGIEELPPSLNKLNCADEPEKISRLYEALRERLTGKYEFARTCSRLIEIAPKGITKGQTLKRIMEEAHIGRDEVLAIGDGENDADCFRQVINSVAMGNAEEYVKRSAQYITASNQENGVYEALRRFLPLA